MLSPGWVPGLGRYAYSIGKPPIPGTLASYGSLFLNISPESRSRLASYSPTNPAFPPRLIRFKNTQALLQENSLPSTIRYNTIRSYPRGRPWQLTLTTAKTGKRHPYSNPRQATECDRLLENQVKSSGVKV